MGSKPTNKAKTLYDAICKRPGLAPVEYAAQTGFDTTALTIAMNALDAQGFMVYEDDFGRLYPLTDDVYARPVNSTRQP